MPSNPSSKKVDALKHTGATRKNIPTAELQSAAQRAEEMQPVKPVTYDRRFPLASGEVRERDGDRSTRSRPFSSVAPLTIT